MTGVSSPPAAERWACDLLIVGAGPAGTAAAIEANRRGLNAVVVDKARFPRDKCCGDGLTTSALRHLDELGFDPSSAPSWIEVSDATLQAPNGRAIKLPLPTGRGAFAAVCRRAELDANLVALARRQGATVLENHELADLTIQADRVTAHVDQIEFSARYVIAADGMWSTTRKLLGLAPTSYRGEWHAFRQYFREVSPAAANQLTVWFEADLLPGYAWSFPLGDGSANVGFGIQRGRGIPIQFMKTLWPELLARPHIAEFLGPDARPESPHRAWPIPARLGRTPLTAGRVLFVGDAAAATDPLTGEGIGQALETGRMAVRSIVEAGTHNPSRRHRPLPPVAASHHAAGSPPGPGPVGAPGQPGPGHRGPWPWPAPTSGPAATSPAGCSRTTREPWVATPHRWSRNLHNRPGAFHLAGRRRAASVVFSGPTRCVRVMR